MLVPCSCSRPTELTPSRGRCTPPLQLAKGVNVGTLMSADGGIKIADGAPADGCENAPADALMEADEEMARRLQAQMDAQAYAAANRCAGQRLGMHRAVALSGV